MKPKPTKLKWSTIAEAAKWPEGSTVLRVGFVRGKPNWHLLESSGYHRPDWLVPGNPGYQHFAKDRFILLELPTDSR